MEMRAFIKENTHKHTLQMRGKVPFIVREKGLMGFLMDLGLDLVTWLDNKAYET